MTRALNGPEDVRLSEFTLAFLVMGALLLWSMWQPELAGDLELGRTKLTIWATTFLLAPALVLYLFRTVSRGTANLAALFWTAAWVVFVAHAYWAVFIIFDGVEDTFAQQGTVIASGNFALLGLWTLDVILLWLLPARFQFVPFQVLARLLAFAIFAFTLVGLRGGAVQMLGIAFIAVVVVAAIIRAGTHVSTLEPTEALA
ncbi:MAG TPA: hypothetical protein VML54_12115 [Candidatus Limnocylindrales bacterium]|nr:hypothetical protein [Candidatus Limnocylindrales bacterium]